MTESRTAILEGIRRAHRRGPLSAARQAKLTGRLRAHPASLIPARAQPADPAAARALFEEMVDASAATRATVAGWAGVAEAVATYLRERNLPTDIAVAPDSRLDPVAGHDMLTAHRGPALPQDVVGVSVALAGIAETGTLLLASGPDTPTSLNFLPDVHIVAVSADSIRGSYEDAWAEVRARFPTPPRTLNMITGPSRTGDIEQTIQLGAHGPRQVHVVVVNER